MDSRIETQVNQILATMHKVQDKTLEVFDRSSMTFEKTVTRQSDLSPSISVRDLSWLLTSNDKQHPHG